MMEVIILAVIIIFLFMIKLSKGSKDYEQGAGVKKLQMKIGKVTSKYGMRIHPVTKEYKMHNGVDVANKEGTPIMAPCDFEVISARKTDIGGNECILKAGNITIGMSHLMTLPQQGTVIKKGSEVAKMGKTGRVTGPHVHLTTRIDGKEVDPEQLIEFT